MINNLPIKQIAQETADKHEFLALTLSFLVVMLPHFLNLPLWVSAFAVLALGWRLAQSRERLWPMPKWLLVPLVLAGGLSVFAQYWTIVGREPGLALLTVMTSFKFLESRTHRDILILVFLCYFLLATHFLFGQTILIAIYMLLALMVVTTTLITINQRDATISIRERIKSSSRLIILSLPIMLLLFVLVPRIPGPIWGITQEQRGGVTGLSETMSPGQISNLILSNEVAFRVKFKGDVPAQQQLYWRGPVMAGFDGTTWRQRKHRKINRFKLYKANNPVHYTVTLEPHGKNWLFGLDIPVLTLSDSYMSSEYQLTSTKAINDLKRYDMTSYLSYQLEPDEDLEYLITTSENVAGKNPRTYALGQQWSAQFDSDIEVVQQALNMFRNEEYVYTLQPPALGANQSDEFLFETRRGFCEHYASSFALLMRAAGIPSRVVTGYQGGEMNEVADYMIVRQSDAHAWTEVFIEERGWVRVDPTAAVSPDRIESGLEYALRDSTSNFKIGDRNPLISKLLFNWDNIQKTWNDWVLNYDQYKQARFLKNLGLGIKSWGDMIISLVISLMIFSGIYWGVVWYRDRAPKPEEYELIINRLLKKLAKAGVARKPAEGLTEYLQRIQKENDYHDPALEKIINTYHKIKYARGFHKPAIIKRFTQMTLAWHPVITQKN